VLDRTPFKRVRSCLVCADGSTRRFIVLFREEREGFVYSRKLFIDLGCQEKRAQKASGGISCVALSLWATDDV